MDSNGTFLEYRTQSFVNSLQKSELLFYNFMSANQQPEQPIPKNSTGKIKAGYIIIHFTSFHTSKLLKHFKLEISSFIKVNQSNPASIGLQLESGHTKSNKC